MFSSWWCAFLGVASVFATDYFVEKFDDGGKWTERWVQSKHKDDYGAFKLTAGKFYGDAEKDKGIQTSQDARFYELSAKIPKPFGNEGKDLVIQFTVKHEQRIDCGGGYIKLLPADADLEKFNGDTPYFIMFGPDICGPKKKVHVIFNYKGKNHLIKKEISCKDDEFTHLYTLIVKPNNTYEVLIDNESQEKGNLEDDWDFLKPKEINDPNAKKPQDWVDDEYIDDPDDKKPEDWDKPEHIPDPDAKKPDDWDDEMDGEWEPPQIDNPDFKGEWKPKQMKNPAYKGPWIHPKIANPEYMPDDTLYKYDNIGAVGFDLWQVKSGTIFDNIIITDDPERAKSFGEETWGKTKGPEKEMKEKQDKEEEEKMKAEAEKEKAKDSEKEEKDEDDLEEKEKKDEKEKSEEEEHKHADEL
ncbi:unnamed protein product [Soboliphyme baturini]|uniref:Calreticulin n=1 Tax=Soboliphyme baturini TaxID=241478 RepID=A0A183IK56_9BILA|nr:unnamed protein product [Soboliphyme baturini]